MPIQFKMLCVIYVYDDPNESQKHVIDQQRCSRVLTSDLTKLCQKPALFQQYSFKQVHLSEIL